MLGRDYTAQVSAIAISAAQDLWEAGPADDKPVKFIGMDLAQATDFGDAQDEVVKLATRRGNTASGSGGTSPTVRVPDPHDASAGFSLEANNTTKANTSGGTHQSFGWTVRLATPTWWPDGFGLGSDQGNTTACVELVSAPVDSITVEQGIYVREY